MDIIKNEEYEIKITGTTSEGSGVGKIDGFAIFVPNTTVGDICLVKIVKLNKSYGFGKLESIITPSPSRIDVDCDKFEQCGGCTYRHISYDAELKIKAELVENAFRRIGGIDTQISPIIPTEFQSRYRNKAQFPVGINSDGEVISGFYAKRSHRIVSKCHCDLQPQFFADIQQDILAFLSDNNIFIYDEVNHKGLIRHIYIRYAQITNEVMVCLVATSSNIPNIDALITLLTQKYDTIKSIVINVNKDKTNVILGQQCKTVYGADFITDIICDIKVKISPLSFYQVNRIQAEVLYNKAIEYADLKPTDTLIDLYCGTGTIGLCAASKVKNLIGVEIVEQAIADANENAKAN
ncbi:MAG: 23S rRNA (uracil(1939)-C(5))-methyltransferase RlmD [Oscillospiraceae bacterium]